MIASHIRNVILEAALPNYNYKRITKLNNGFRKCLCKGMQPALQIRYSYRVRAGYESGCINHQCRRKLERLLYIQAAIIVLA